MADFPTLGIRVENGQAVRAIKDQDAALRRLAEASATLSEREVKSYASMLRSTGQTERYKQVVQQLAREKLDADAVTARLNATTLSASNAFTGATLSTGRLRSSLTSLASQAIGTNTSLGQLGNVLGSFAIGSGPMIGILLGIAAVGYAYNKLTEDTQKAKKANDDLLDSLEKTAKSAFNESPEGAAKLLAFARKQEAEALAGARRFNETGGGPSWQAAMVDKRAKEAIADRVRAERNLQSAQGDRTKQQWEDTNRIFDFEKSARADLERIDTERAAKAKKADEAAMARLKARLDMLKHTFDAEFGAGVSFSIEQGLALKFAFKPINAGTALDREIARNNAPAPLPSGYAQTYQGRQAQTQNTNLLLGHSQAVAKATKELSTFGKAAIQVGSTITQSLAYFAVSKFGGGAGASLGAGIGSAAATGASAFGSKALGAAIFGPLGAIAGGFIGSLFDSGQAAKEHAQALRESRRQLESAIADYHDRALGVEGNLESQIRHEHDRAEALRQEAIKKYHGDAIGSLIFGSGEAAKALRDKIAGIDADEKLIIARLREQDAIKATTEAMNAFNTSLRNAPSGFKIERYINDHAAARPWDYNGGPLNAPFNPLGGPTGTGGANTKSVTIGSVNLVIPKGMKPEDVGPAFMRFLDKVAAQTVGGNAPVYEALEYAPRS